MSLIRNLLRRSPEHSGMTFAGPPDRCIYAIGDIHGRSDLLAKLLSKIERDTEHGDHPKQLVFLGDYVDRGLDSRGVIDICIALEEDGYIQGNWIKPIFLKGNHEVAMLGFIQKPHEFKLWLDHGGLATLASYGVRTRTHDNERALTTSEIATELGNRLPDNHLRFLRQSRPYHQSGSYIFVHAAIDPALPLEQQSEATLYWRDQDSFSSSSQISACVVHGHTITPNPHIGQFHIGVDTGAYYSGRLTCLKIDSIQKSFIST